MLEDPGPPCPSWLAVVVIVVVMWLVLEGPWPPWLVEVLLPPLLPLPDVVVAWLDRVFVNRLVEISLLQVSHSVIGQTVTVLVCVTTTQTSLSGSAYAPMETKGRSAGKYFSDRMVVVEERNDEKQ